MVRLPSISRPRLPSWLKDDAVAKIRELFNWLLSFGLEHAKMIIITLIAVPAVTGGTLGALDAANIINPYGDDVEPNQTFTVPGGKPGVWDIMDDKVVFTPAEEDLDHNTLQLNLGANIGTINLVDNRLGRSGVVTGLQLTADPGSFLTCDNLNIVGLKSSSMTITGSKFWSLDILNTIASGNSHSPQIKTVEKPVISSSAPTWPMVDVQLSSYDRVIIDALSGSEVGTINLTSQETNNGGVTLLERVHCGEALIQDSQFGSDTDISTTFEFTITTSTEIQNFTVSGAQEDGVVVR